MNSLSNSNLLADKLNLSPNSENFIPNYDNFQNQTNFNIDEEEEEKNEGMFNLKEKNINKERVLIPAEMIENNDDNEVRRRKTLQALEKRLSLNE